MTLRRKLLWGFGGLLLIVLAGSALSIAVLTRYSHTLDQLFRENYDSVVYCDRMKEALDALNARAERLAWNEPDETVSDAAAEMKLFAENLRLQRSNLSLPGESERTESLASLWQELAIQYNQLARSVGPARHAIYQTRLLRQYQLTRKAADVIAAMNLSNMVSVDGRVKRTLRSVREALIILAVAGTVLATTLVVVMGATVLKPLQTLTRSAGQIGSGNLNLRIDVRSRDEVGQLAEAFNTMAARLREFRRVDHQRLERTQQTTQLAIDSLRDAVFVIGPDGHVEICNETAHAHFGIAPGLQVQSLHLEWFSELYDKVLASGQPLDPQGYQSAIQLFDHGEERFLLPRGVPMFDSAGVLIGVTVILMDVTQLRRADELKSGMISTVSHELRTPLTAIRMAVMMLGDEKFGKLSEQQKTLLAAAISDSDRLYRTIENLLSISRIESGGQVIELRPMSAAEIVAQTVDPLRSGFAQKKIRLAVDIADALPPVMADPSCIGLALNNLLSNALKYTPSDGEVHVAVEANGEFVAFSVADSGPGIPEQYRSRIFERFFRVPTASGPSGAGLGLAIAREIVDAHGGTIGFEGNGGSRFTFKIPRATVDAPVGDAALSIAH